jgi:hypothetical protein
MKSITPSSYSRKFVTLGARFAASRTTKRLKKTTVDEVAQKKAYTKLVASFSKTSAWSSLGIEEKIPYNEFRDTVALHRYEDLSNFVEKMKAGEANVLWPGTCSNYAVSSGTTAGRTKYIPLTGTMLTHFKKAGLQSLLYYAGRTPKAAVFQGRHLFLGGSTGLNPLVSSSGFKAYCGDLSGITAKHLPAWIEKYLFEPGEKIAAMDNWPNKIEAIADKTQHSDISLIAGIPSWILILAEALRRKTGVTHLQQLWPHFECLMHGGVPIGPYVNELRKALGPTINFHEVYPASEGFIAAQDTFSTELGMRLITDCGLFFEFLPMSHYDDSKLSFLGKHAVALTEVEIGKDYALILTTPGGLARYVIGDVVRFISTTPPRLVYVGRTALQLSAFGEHVIEKEVTDSLVNTCNHFNLNVGNFHVAPLFADPDKGRPRGCHEWWIELASGHVSDLKAFASQLDSTLQSKNEDYEAKRAAGGLADPVVHIINSGTFESWLKARGKWGGQNKMPRCRSDREIADAISGFTQT